MISIDNLPTSDNYSEPLTLGPIPTAEKIIYVVANNPATVQFATHAASGTVQEWGPEILITPNAGDVSRAQGMRFKSASPGKPAQIVAQLIEPGDPLPSTGTPFTSFLTPSGTLVPSQGFAVFSVLDYGAVGNGATDDTSSIQKAINAAHAAGGGVVYFPLTGNPYIVNGTLILDDYENITLLGEGNAGRAIDDAPSGVILLCGASNANAMVQWREVNAARSLRGNSIQNLTFWGNTICATGLWLQDHVGGFFQNIYLRDFSTCALELGTSGGLGVGLQDCLFQNFSIRQFGVTNGIGLRMSAFSGTSNNVSLNTFINIHINCANGTCVDVGAVDTNNFFSLNTFASGSGIGVLLRGSNTAGLQSRANKFYASQISNTNSVLAQGAGLAFPSQDNLIFNDSSQGGVGFPVIEAGAKLTFVDDGAGVWILPGLPAGAPAQSGQLWNNAGVVHIV